MESLRDQLLRHEGLRLKPYRDTVGRLTVGVGRNLDDVGISHEEAMLLLEHDITRARDGCEAAFPWFVGLSPERQAVLVNMAFNLGLGGLIRFRKMLACLETGNYEGAAVEMLDSAWAVQVGKRATELAAQMRGYTSTPDEAGKEHHGQVSGGSAGTETQG